MGQLTATLCLLLISLVPAWAEAANASESNNLFYGHVAVTALGVLFAVRMADQAFGRRALTLADTPTFPRYMTSRGQYMLGNVAFIAFASFVFLLILYLHREVVQVAEVAGLPVPKGVSDAIEKNEASYLMIIFAMGGVYLFLLRKENEWNVLLMMRDLIQTWISVPQLGNKIVDEIQYALKIPAGCLPDVIRDSVALSESDFSKDRRTIDRRWAELSYMRWWILERRGSGDDATFFAEPSFGLEELLGQYNTISLAVTLLKAGTPLQPPTTAESVSSDLRVLHRKFCRLVACYLLYRNGSKQRLAVEARKFGIPFADEHCDNPLRYSIIFLLTLIAAVNLGVYGSAILFDLYSGERLLFALANQEFDRIFSWTMYALSNYGLAIVVVLAVRLAMWRYFEINNQSRLVIYCWTFVLAFLVGPLGLTLAVKLSGHPIAQQLSYPVAYYNMLRWGVGPGLVAVCISYFMDRQLSSDLPNIDSSAIARRVVITVAFACFTVLLQCSQLLAATGDPTWSNSKLRSVAVGTTFVVTLALALVAQFGLRKPSQHTPLPMPAATPAE
jgi:hypothetical protein